MLKKTPHPKNSTLSFAQKTLPYFPDSRVYFDCLISLSGRVWLDSGKPASTYGRFDILSAAPSHTFSNPSTEELRVALMAQWELNAPFLKALNHLPFKGGLIGYFNYEYHHAHFRIHSAKTSHFSPSMLGLFDWALIQDHQEKTATVFFLAGCNDDVRHDILYRLEKVKTEAPKIEKNNALPNIHFHHDTEKQRYLDDIKNIHDYILAGDTYQINYAQRFHAPFTGNVDEVYHTLRNTVPSHYSAFIQLGDETVLSLSPERFIHIENRHAETKPIKGTAPRGKTPEEDKANAEALVQSEKNRAENVMIVDLMRNDFSQHCKPFTVKTPRLFALESYANVHHLVSTVTGELNEDIHPLDFFMSCFPGGSITGAPKKRAMEIIDELEPHARNIYCGSVVNISMDGTLDSSIAIRTLLHRNDTLYCWGGGGIVYDSDAESEYEETLHKVGNLMRALERS